MRIASITITNFGPHRHLSMPLAPLTVITGDNGTGKSSIAEALPAAYWRVIPEKREPDKKSIGEALKRGEAVPGAELVPSERLQVA